MPNCPQSCSLLLFCIYVAIYCQRMKHTNQQTIQLHTYNYVHSAYVHTYRYSYIVHAWTMHVQLYICRYKTCQLFSQIHKLFIMSSCINTHADYCVFCVYAHVCICMCICVCIRCSYVCVCVCVWVHACVCMHAHTYTHACICVCICVHVATQLCVHMHACACMHACINNTVYMQIHVCMCVCMCVCVCMCGQQYSCLHACFHYACTYYISKPIHVCVYAEIHTYTIIMIISCKTFNHSFMFIIII